MDVSESTNGGLIDRIDGAELAMKRYISEVVVLLDAALNKTKGSIQVDSNSLT
jgi:hypothetical protein